MTLRAFADKVSARYSVERNLSLEAMKTNIWAALIRNSIAASLLVTVFVTSSAFALAGAPDKQRLMGELTVSGASLESETAFVTVDGERAATGRSVLSSSNLTTTNVGAVVSLGKAGRIEIAPNSSLNLEFTENSINANLTAGRVKVFNAAGVEAKVTTKDDAVTGSANENGLFTVDVNSGATKVLAESGTITRKSGQTTTQDPDGGLNLSSTEVLIPVAILAGIVAVSVIYVITKDEEELTISPTR